MPQKKLILTLLTLFVVGIMGAIGFSIVQTLNWSQETVEDIKTEFIETANVSGTGVSIVVTEGDRKKWTLNADKILYYQHKNDAKLIGIEGLFFNDDGKPVMRFFAPEGNYINTDNEITLTGGVKAETYQEEALLQAETEETAVDIEPSNTVQLNAPQMQWSSRSKEVIAKGKGDKKVELSHGIFGSSKANKCIFTLDLSTLSMQGKAVSNITL